LQLRDLQRWIGENQVKLEKKLPRMAQGQVVITYAPQ